MIERGKLGESNKGCGVSEYEWYHCIISGEWECIISQQYIINKLEHLPEWGQGIVAAREDEEQEAITDFLFGFKSWHHVTWSHSKSTLCDFRSQLKSQVTMAVQSGPKMAWPSDFQFSSQAVATLCVGGSTKVAQTAEWHVWLTCSDVAYVCVNYLPGWSKILKFL